MQRIAQPIVPSTIPRGFRPYLNQAFYKHYFRPGKTLTLLVRPMGLYTQYEIYNSDSETLTIVEVTEPGQVRL